MKYLQLTLLLFICCSFSSCREKEYSTIIINQFTNFNNYDFDYHLCVMDLHTSFSQDSLQIDDSMKCFSSVSDVYESLSLSSIPEIQFRYKMAVNSIKRISTYIPPEVYASLEEYRIHYDKEIASIYSEKGIAGILELLSAKQIHDWDKYNQEQFKFIASLCWQHNILFKWTMNCEEPTILWSIYGNDKLLKQYYHPQEAEEWHIITPSTN